MVDGSYCESGVGRHRHLSRMAIQRDTLHFYKVAGEEDLGKMRRLCKYVILTVSSPNAVFKSL